MTEENSLVFIGDIDWEKKFTKTILNRGEEYFQQGKVTNLVQKDGKYTAFVRGQRGYSVFISTKGEKITRMSCSCPYANDGTHCKHMAAVLYAIEAKEVLGECEPFSQMQEEQGNGDLNQAAADAVTRLERYQYYQIAQMERNLKILPGTVRKAQKLIQGKQIILKQIRQVYRTDNGEPMIEATASVREDAYYSYLVRMVISRDKIEQMRCENYQCDYYGGYSYKGSKPCEHKIALFFLLKEYLQEHRIGDATDYTGTCFLQNFGKHKVNSVIAQHVNQGEPIQLVPKLINQDGELAVNFRIGTSKLYVLKNLTEFCQLLDTKASGTYGKNTVIIHDLTNFTEPAKRVAAFIQQVVEETNQMVNKMNEKNRYGSSGKLKEVGQSVELFGWRLDQFYQLLEGQTLEHEEKIWGLKSKQNLLLAEAEPEITLTIRPENLGDTRNMHGITCELRMPEFFQGVGTAYYISSHGFHIIPKEYLEHISPLLDIPYEIGANAQIFRIGRQNLSEFYYSVLPELENYVTVVDQGTEVIDQYLPPEAQFLFYLDADEQTITCKAHVKYGNREFSLIQKDNQAPENAQVEVFRNLPKEGETVFILQQWFPEVDEQNDWFHCGKDEDAIYNVISEGVEQLLLLGEVQSTERFRNMNLARKTKLSVGVSVSNGLLELDISTEDISREELLDVLKSYRLKKKYHRLKNGDFLSVQEESIEMLSEMMESLHITPKEFVKGNMKVPAYRGLYLEKLLEEHEEIYSSRDSHFRSLVKEFKTVKDADFEVPSSLDKTLRSYQKTGYKWLCMIDVNHFGGILADDMGLGKTLQMITVLLAGKVDGSQETSLIVAPASLVFNWKEEIANYAPELQVGMVVGKQEERFAMIHQYQDYDCLITSYDLLKRDIAEYEGKSFEYEVIDEAQYIKNHTTEAAKAVKVIQSKTRFALTGTPIENRLSELWSIFDYLMPGFLYGYDVFKRELETPIVKYQEENAVSRLQKMVAPFILRRLKSDVLKDLPEKLEEVKYAHLEDNQRTLYDAQVVHMQQTIQSQDASEFQKNKLQVLAELTRLRQICCDPSLCFEQYKGESAKRETCIDLVESAIEGGHKILLFSQFTSMLEILQRELQNREITYYTITGATPKEQRQQLVKKFNQDDTNVFLISLKAGGTGLNLTGADVVIHYDPWWNQAVQNQATDRAHRIGQTNKVTVYQLIVKDSVEEKIVKIQNTKRNLADQIMSGEMGQLGSMSRDDLLELLQ